MTVDQFMQKLTALGTEGYPTSAHLEVTHRCNGSCFYCYLTDEQKPDLPLSRLLNILTRLKKNGVLFLYLTGGEPFLRPDFQAILRYAVECDFFEINILSNGTLITGEHIAFLREHTSYFKKIQLSVFSDNEQENDRYLGIPDAGEKTLLAAEKLLEAGIAVSLSLNVRPFNVDRIGSIMDHFESRGFVINFSPYTIITPHTELLLNNQNNYAFFRKMFLGLGEERLKRYIDTFHRKRSEPKRTTLCNGRLCTLSIDPQGTVYPCPSFRYYKLGNILKEPDLHKLYTSGNVRRLHEISLEEYARCARCEYVNFCSLCIGRWHTRFGSFGTIDRQLCDYAHALADIIHERK